MVSSSFLPSEGKISLGCDPAPQVPQVCRQAGVTATSSTHRLRGASSPAQTWCHRSPLNCSLAWCRVSSEEVRVSFDPTWLYGPGVLSLQHHLAAPLAASCSRLLSTARRAVLQVFGRVFEAGCKAQGLFVVFKWVFELISRAQSLPCTGGLGTQTLLF